MNSGKKQGKISAGETGEKTHVSDEAFILDISSRIAEAPEMNDDEARKAKVEAIKAQLSNGAYSISGRDVAGKILSLLKN